MAFELLKNGRRGSIVSSRKKSIKILNILITLLFLIGGGILLYPSVSEIWNNYRNSKLISDYAASVKTIDHSELDALYEEALEYNRNHKFNHIVDVFERDDYEFSDAYSKILNLDDDSLMAYLNIPKIKVNLAIYHGVRGDVLNKGCGHLEGTSLPVGGPTSHSVLSAHRGLPSARLFSDLDQLEIGDVFYIHVLNRVLTYQVDRINVVLPSEFDELELREGEDLVTLLTCTPYGVNSHRLLVRGKRVPDIPAKGPEEADLGGAEEDGGGGLGSEIKYRLKPYLMIAGVLALFLLYLFLSHRNKRSGSAVKNGEKPENRREGPGTQPK